MTKKSHSSKQAGTLRPNDRRMGQSAVEYLILLGVVVAIVLISFARVLPSVSKGSERFFNETSNVIMGDDPSAVCTPGGWTAWTACPPCGGGNRTRVCTDTCGYGCSGAGAEPCQYVPCPPVNGGWCPWSPCNGACGMVVGQTRSCNCPAPSAGGQPCVGPTTQQCPPFPCPWGECLFAPWLPDPCPVLCGGAVQTRECVCDPGAPLGSTCAPDAEGTQLTRICNPQGCTCPATTVDVSCGINTTGGFDVYTIPFLETASNTPPLSIMCPPLCYGTLTYACVDGSWNYDTALCQPSCSTGIRDGICDPGWPGPGESGLNCPGDCCDAFTGCGVNSADPNLSCRSMCGPGGCQPFDWMDSATINSYCDDFSEVCVNYYICGGDTYVCGPNLGDWSLAGTTCVCGDGVCHDATNSGGLTEKCAGDNCGPSCFGRCPADCSPCCGDGVMNGSEECDGVDFGSDTCVARGYTAGFLFCTGLCTVDEGNCCTGVATSCNACSNAPYCGTLNGVDNCGSPCTQDCGVCPVCPGQGCEANENCDTCPADCGACFCGNGRCDSAENCTSCPGDCGGCICGNGSCDPGEDCTWCWLDCPDTSGDGTPWCCLGGGDSCTDHFECCSRTCAGLPGPGICF